MSIQSEWQWASKDEPAEFELDYVKIKVQAICKPGSEKPEIQVRLATEFDTDWMESQFDEWLIDAIDTAVEETAKKAYPFLRNRRACIKGSVDKDHIDELAALNALIDELEQSNPGLIRA